MRSLALIALVLALGGVQSALVEPYLSIAKALQTQGQSGHVPTEAVAMLPEFAVSHPSKLRAQKSAAAVRSTITCTAKSIAVLGSTQCVLQPLSAGGVPEFRAASTFQLHTTGGSASQLQLENETEWHLTFTAGSVSQIALLIVADAASPAKNAVTMLFVTDMPTGSRLVCDTTLFAAQEAPEDPLISTDCHITPQKNGVAIFISSALLRVSAMRGSVSSITATEGETVGNEVISDTFDFQYTAPGTIGPDLLRDGLGSELLVRITDSCFGVTNCNALHRDSCNRNTDSKCGRCWPGFHTEFEGVADHLDEAPGNSQCFADCWLAPQCAALNRQRCSDVPQTCGACLPGHVAIVPGEQANGNTFCQVDCSAASAAYCKGLNRDPCGDSTAANTCGGCLDGYHLVDGNCEVDCSISTQDFCFSMHRRPCSSTPHTCGPCFGGYGLPDPSQSRTADGNLPCLLESHTVNGASVLRANVSAALGDARLSIEAAQILLSNFSLGTQDTEKIIYLSSGEIHVEILDEWRSEAAITTTAYATAHQVEVTRTLSLNKPDMLLHTPMGIVECASAAKPGLVETMARPTWAPHPTKEPTAQTVYPDLGQLLLPYILGEIVSLDVATAADICLLTVQIASFQRPCPTGSALPPQYSRKAAAAVKPQATTAYKVEFFVVDHARYADTLQWEDTRTPMEVLAGLQQQAGDSSSAFHAGVLTQYVGADMEIEDMQADLCLDGSWTFHGHCSDNGRYAPSTQSSENGSPEDHSETKGDKNWLYIGSAVAVGAVALIAMGVVVLKVARARKRRREAEATPETSTAPRLAMPLRKKKHDNLRRPRQPRAGEPHTDEEDAGEGFEYKEKELLSTMEEGVSPNGAGPASKRSKLASSPVVVSSGAVMHSNRSSRKEREEAILANDAMQTSMALTVTAPAASPAAASSPRDGVYQAYDGKYQADLERLSSDISHYMTAVRSRGLHADPETDSSGLWRVGADQLPPSQPMPSPSNASVVAVLSSPMNQDNDSSDTASANSSIAQPLASPLPPKAPQSARSPRKGKKRVQIMTPRSETARAARDAFSHAQVEADVPPPPPQQPQSARPHVQASRVAPMDISVAKEADLAPGVNSPRSPLLGRRLSQGHAVAIPAAINTELASAQADDMVGRIKPGRSRLSRAPGHGAEADDSAPRAPMPTSAEALPYTAPAGHPLHTVNSETNLAAKIAESPEDA